MTSTARLLTGVALSACACGVPPADAAPPAQSDAPAHRLPAPAGATEPREGEVEVWVDLSVPALSSLPRANREQRSVLRARIERQQNEVMRQLAALGAREEARVLEVRNALAVRIPASALQEARALAGVLRVREVTHIKREPPRPKVD